MNAEDIKDAIEGAVDKGLAKVTASHRTAIIVAVAVLGAMIIGAAVWG